MTEITRLFDLLDWYREKFPAKPDAFLFKKEKRWHAYSSSDYIEYSKGIAQGFLSMGLERGTRIGTIMYNCPEWNFFDMGIMLAGAIQIPIYPTVSAAHFRFILSDAQIQYLIVSDAHIYNRIKKFGTDLPDLLGVFTIEKVKGVPHWKELVEKGKMHPDPAAAEQISRSIQPDDLATIIYTSGTTGKPKGVMLSHRNFISNFTGCARIPDFSSSDRAMSFLPLCHVYERMLNYLYQSFGMSVYYCESLEKIGEYAREIRPHTFACVPRVLEKIYNRIVTRGRQFRGPRKTIFFWALRQGHKFEFNHARGWFYDVKLWIANLVVFRKWRKLLGNNLKLIVSGGAALHPRLARIFWAAKIPLMEGYGLTETSPVIAVSDFEPDGFRFGTVGKVLPGVEVRIAEDGEILCRGPNVMLGYFNRPERTREVIDDEGWLHTGDIGLLEEGKYLRITDRKKEIFKTSTGKYIAPQPIEQRFRESPFIEHMLVIGENRKYAAALIVPNFDHLKSWCAVKKITFTTPEKAVRNVRIIKRLKQEVEHFNQDLGQTEKIKKIRLIAGPWTEATGELSPTMKVRRKFIQEKYKSLIEETYRSTEYNYQVEED
jgi:long-chain acyl-CoA synthetase